MAKKFSIRDQAAHSGSCFGFGILGFPLFGMLIAIIWAITREYYQEKRKMEAARRIEPTFFQVMGMIDYWKRDLKFSYLGALVGNIAGTVIWYFSIRSYFG